MNDTRNGQKPGAKARKGLGTDHLEHHHAAAHGRQGCPDTRGRPRQAAFLHRRHRPQGEGLVDEHHLIVRVVVVVVRMKADDVST